jgi:hypothetical protein
MRRGGPPSPSPATSTGALLRQRGCDTEEDHAGADAPEPEAGGVRPGGVRQRRGRRRAEADTLGEATASLSHINRCRTPGARPFSLTPPPLTPPPPLPAPSQDAAIAVRYIGASADHDQADTLIQFSAGRCQKINAAEHNAYGDGGRGDTGTRAAGGRRSWRCGGPQWRGRRNFAACRSPHTSYRPLPPSRGHHQHVGRLLR